MDYLEVLDREVRKVATKRPSILELGCLNGASSVVLGNIAKDNGGWIDYVDDTFRQAFFSNIQENNITHYNYFKGKTKSVLPYLTGSFYHVVFIDAGHTYDEVIYDLYQAKRLLEPGGLLIGDDLNNNVKLDQLPEAWLESHKNEYGSKLGYVNGTIYAGVFVALKEFCEDTGFKFEREENLYWGTI